MAETTASASWKNQRKPSIGPSQMVAIRIPRDLVAAVHKIADLNDTTTAAIVRHQLEQFVEANGGAKAKAGLFG